MNAIKEATDRAIKRLHDIFMREKMNLVIMSQDNTKCFWVSLSEQPYNNLEDMVVNDIPYEVYGMNLKHDGWHMNEEITNSAKAIIKIVSDDLDRAINEIEQWESLKACGAFSGAFSSSTYEDYETSNIGF